MEKGTMDELCHGRATFALQPFSTHYLKATQQVISENEHTHSQEPFFFLKDKSNTNMNALGGGRQKGRLHCFTCSEVL